MDVGELPMIVSGCPGCGKTTLAKVLADREERGVHITTDRFYEFLSHRIDPSTPESRAQNTSVVRAFLAAAQAWHEEGYAVFIDGVIGPWWFDEIGWVFPQVHYVMLDAQLDTVLARASARAETAQASATSGIVRVMHAQFAAVANCDGHKVVTDGRRVDEVATEVLRKWRDGELLLEP